MGNKTRGQKRSRDNLAIARAHIASKRQKTSCSVPVKDANSNIVLGPDGKPLKEKIKMVDARLPNGNPQSLYFPDGHERAGWFKGMVQILVERGYVDAPKLRAECKDFKCSGDQSDCCCRRLMYIQPDFINVESRLEASCRKRGFDVLFLPKFH